MTIYLADMFDAQPEACARCAGFGAEDGGRFQGTCLSRRAGDEVRHALTAAAPIQMRADVVDC